MAPPRDLSIRPLGLGEIIDRSIALTRRHFGPLFAAMLAIEAPALALGRLQQARLVDALGLVADPARALAEGASLGWYSLAFGLALVALQLVATAAAAAIVAPSLDPSAGGGPPAGRRVLAVATAGLVQLVLLVVAPLLGALPGLVLAVRARGTATRWVGLAAAAVGGLVLFLVTVLRLVLVPAVAAVEGRGGPAAALRSARLMAPVRGGRFFDRPGLRASLVLLGTFLIAVAASGLATLPRAIAARVAGTVGPLGLLDATLPLPLEVIVSIFEAAATAAIQPFSLVAVTVLYFDRRARTEALDVEIWASRLEAGP